MFDNKKPNIILLTGTTSYRHPIYKSLGLMRLAQELRNNGFEVLVIHHLEIFSKSELYQFLQSMISDQTLFLGINNFMYSDPFAEGIIKNNVTDAVHKMLPYLNASNQDFKSFVRSLNPKVKLVLGGPKAMDSPMCRDFDLVVLGYADVSVVNLARHLRDGTPLDKSHRSLNGFTVVDDAKAPTFDFENHSTYLLEQDIVYPSEPLPIEIARGCIFSCAFCSYPLNGKKKFDYGRSVEKLYQEFIYNYEKFGTTKYMFNDDTFNDSVEKIEMMLDISSKLPFQLIYWAFIRLDLVTAKMETADMLFKSGLRSMFCGIESWNPETGKIIGKKANAESQIKTIKHINNLSDNQISIDMSFIIGLPKETVSSQRRTFDYLEAADLNVNAAFFSPLFLKNVKNSNPMFASRISRDYTKYGYEIIGQRGDELLWKNEHMDVYQAYQLRDEVMPRLKRYPFDAFSEDMFSLSALDDFTFQKQQELQNQGRVQYLIKKQEKTYAVANWRRQKIKEIYNLDFDLPNTSLIDPYLDQVWCEFYQDVKDPSWPELLNYRAIDQLPTWIIDECLVHADTTREKGNVLYRLQEIVAVLLDAKQRRG